MLFQLARWPYKPNLAYYYLSILNCFNYVALLSVLFGERAYIYAIINASGKVKSAPIVDLKAQKVRFR
jgi:hypothetical protein